MKILFLLLSSLLAYAGGDYNPFFTQLGKPGEDSRAAQNGLGEKTDGTVACCYGLSYVDGNMRKTGSISIPKEVIERLKKLEEGKNK